MRRWLLVAGIAVLGLGVACTRTSSSTSDDLNSGDQEVVESEDVDWGEYCWKACIDAQCGEIDGCLCGPNGDGTCEDLSETCDAETNQCKCTPSCGETEDWACGDDGCGGSCGTCEAGSACADMGDGVKMCVGCPEKCAELGLECGQFETGIPELPECNCGDCPESLQCFDGTCDCVPNCGGKECGGDGCDGSCGNCGGSQEICTAEGQCLCQPECEGKVCGDDGCGGQCGIPCGDNLVCVNGECITCSEDDDCDDGLECTTDSCTDGECVYGIQDGPCDDSNKCTENESCVEGQCMGDILDCDDGDDCTDDTCEPATGCASVPNTGNDCDDGKGKCVEGECKAKVPSCPEGWSYRAGLCYRPFNKETDEELTWDAAEAFCGTFSGTLTSIHDESTNDYVKELVNKTNFTDDTTWIGLNDLEMEGQYKWSDGTPYDFDAWAGGQPNNWAGCWLGECPQNCVAIEDPMIGFGGWNDFECDKEYRYICQTEAEWN